MSVTIKINDVLKTEFIYWKSLRINNILTSQIDTASFVVRNYGGNTCVPVNEDDIKIYDNSDLIFAGTISRITETLKGARLIEYRVECADYTRSADRKKIAETFSGQTVSYIIDALNTKYLSGFTVTNVDCDKIIDHIVFNYESFSECVRRLAEMTGYDWYIDYEKDIHFFSKETNDAPFDLTDTNGKHINKSLKIKRDTSQLRNVVIVRGGEYLGDSYSDEIVSTGSPLAYPLPYKFEDFSISVDEVAKTVGVDGVDDEDDYDCLYNMEEKIVKFKEATKPADGELIEYSGTPYAPILVEAKDEESIDDYGGEFTYRVVDERISTRASARERGKAELNSYADKISEASFTTYESGLLAGQQINVQSDIRNLDEDFIINRVVTKLRTPTDFVYEVNLVTTKTFGIIEFLSKMLMREDQRLEVREGETIDKLWTLLETLPTIADVTPVFGSPFVSPWYIKNANTPIGVVSFCQCS